MATTLTGQIVEALGAAISVTALVPATSIYMGELPEGTGLPACEVAEGSTSIDLNFSSSIIERAGITVTVYAVGAAATDLIQRTVQAILDPYTASFTNNQIMACLRESMEIQPDGRQVQGDLVFKATSRYTVLVEVSLV